MSLLSDVIADPDRKRLLMFCTVEISVSTKLKGVIDTQENMEMERPGTKG